MDKPFLSAYSRLLIKTCHKRGALAMGGMAAFIPAKDAAVNEQVFAKVHADKQREADNGHDGTWVAHPGLADTAMAVFNATIPAGAQNQIGVLREQMPPSRPPICWPPARVIAPRRACAPISASPCNIWKPGSTATAACPSTD
jgi:malate synthase